MAGAEGESRLDRDGELVWRHAVAVMAAVDDEAPGRHRDEIFQARLDPVPGFDGVEDERVPELISRLYCNEVAHPRPARRPREMQRDVPLSVRLLEGGDRRIFLEEHFGEDVDN